VCPPPFTAAVCTSAATTGGGGGGGGTGTGSGAIVTDLEFEIDSTITIRTFNTMAVGDGVATVHGRFPLTLDEATGEWRGSGSLRSSTTSGKTACPSIALDGDGEYDWVVRAAHVGATLDAAHLSVHLETRP